MQNRFQPYNKSLLINIFMNNEYKLIWSEYYIPEYDEINKQDKYKQVFSDNTALGNICEIGYINILRLLLSHPDINVNINGVRITPPFHIALYSKNINIVKLLLNHPNIDVNIKSIYGTTPLMAVCYNYDISVNIEIARLLLSHPDIDVNIQDENGWTALMYACDDDTDDDKLEAIKLLMRHPNIDVSVKSNTGKTALDYISDKINSKNMELMLLQNKFNILNQHNAQ